MGKQHLAEMVYLDFWNGKDGEMEEEKVRINQL
jgi:hypothetical protein